VKKPASTLSKLFFLSSTTFVDFSPNGKKAEAAAVVKETGEEVVANAVVEKVEKATADKEAARVEEGTVEQCVEEIVFTSDFVSDDDFEKLI
jgi:creatinine amidohydrolase/Fe(II)-dependent formamide hydrolase-like protein